MFRCVCLSGGGYPAIQGPHPTIQGPHPDIFKVVHNEARASGWLASYWNAFLLFPPTNELYDGNVFTGVCLSTGGLYQGDIGKERAVHILLECILV